MELRRALCEKLLGRGNDFLRNSEPAWLAPFIRRTRRRRALTGRRRRFPYLRIMSSSAAAPEWRLGFRGAGPKAPRSSVLAFERFGANRHLDGRLLAFPICDVTSRFMGRERSRTDVAQFRYYMIIFTFKQKQNSGRQG
jgi:hypothetical protein